METNKLIDDFEVIAKKHRFLSSELQKLELLKSTNFSKLHIQVQIEDADSLCIKFVLGDDFSLNYELIIQQFISNYQKILMTHKLNCDAEFRKILKSNLL